MADNWFTRTLNRNAEWLGISPVEAAPGSSTAGTLGSFFGGVTAFVSSFTNASKMPLTKSAPDSDSGGLLAGFSKTLSGFTPILIISAIGAGLYLLFKKR